MIFTVIISSNVVHVPAYNGVLGCSQSRFNHLPLVRTQMTLSRG